QPLLVWPGLSLRSPGEVPPREAPHRGFEDSAPATQPDQFKGSLNDGSVRDSNSLGNDHDPVADDMGIAIRFLHVAAVANPDFAANPAVLVHDGAFNHRAIAHAQVGKPPVPIGGAFGV